MFAGQVGGVAVSAALFQTILTKELHKRIHTPDAEEVRFLLRLLLRFLYVALPIPNADDQQDPALVDARRAAAPRPAARGAGLVRDRAPLGVRLRRGRDAPRVPRAPSSTSPLALPCTVHTVTAAADTRLPLPSLPVPTQIPDQPLDQPRPRAHSVGELPNPHPTRAELDEETGGRGIETPERELDSAVASDDDDDDDEEEARGEGRDTVSAPIAAPRRPRRRLSTYESSDGGMDLEDEVIGGSARR